MPQNSDVKASTAYALGKDGKPYRSFRLVKIFDKKWSESDSLKHAATNKSRADSVSTSHLGPLRAGQKIFDAWCRSSNILVIKPTRFSIQETTRGKKSKIFTYTGFREKLDEPREIVVTNKLKNT